jgi:solute carrier family 10 (sodium/bile acid cotransporter), member 7
MGLPMTLVHHLQVIRELPMTTVCHVQVIRELSKPVQGFTKKHSTALSITSTTNLAMIVWQNLSGAQHVLINQAFVSIVYVILLAVGQHLLYLAFNYVIIW